MNKSPMAGEGLATTLLVLCATFLLCITLVPAMREAFVPYEWVSVVTLMLLGVWICLRLARQARQQHDVVADLHEKERALQASLREQETLVAAARKSEARLSSLLERARLLEEVVRAIAAGHDVPSLFHSASEAMEEIDAIDCAAVYGLPEDAMHVEALGSEMTRVTQEAGLAGLRPLANSLPDACLSGGMLYASDLAGLDGDAAARLREAGLRSLIVMPMLSEGETFGLLVIGSYKADAFDSGQAEFLRKLGEHMALAMEQRKLYARLQVAYEELNQRQQAMLQQARVEGLLAMMGGIFHNLNNLLTPIQGFAELSLRKVQDLSERVRDWPEEGDSLRAPIRTLWPRLESDLTDILDASDGIGRIVGRMRDLYRRRTDAAPATDVNLNDILSEAVKLTRPRWLDAAQQQGIAIEIVTDFDPNLPSLLGNAGELSELATNLILNAVAAMPSGGRLTIRTSDEYVTVAMEVSDSGIGMDEETRRRCLEPFFTTKPEGTGLGLATAYGTVQQHGGEITVDSAPGRGTTFRISFPRMTAAPSETRAAQPTLEPGRLHILCVDDEPQSLRVLRDMLKTLGHFPTAVEGGQAAIETLARSLQEGQRFDVVITDLGMPEVPGIEVARFVRAACPETPIVVLSGWGLLVGEDEIAAVVDAIVGKPVSLADLRRVLGGLQYATA